MKVKNIYILIVTHSFYFTFINYFTSHLNLIKSLSEKTREDYGENKSAIERNQRFLKDLAFYQVYSSSGLLEESDLIVFEFLAVLSLII